MEFYWNFKVRACVRARACLCVCVRAYVCVCVCGGGGVCVAVGARTGRLMAIQTNIPFYIGILWPCSPVTSLKNEDCCNSRTRKYFDLLRVFCSSLFSNLYTRFSFPVLRRVTTPVTPHRPIPHTRNVKAEWLG